jgi:cytoskeletal protein RodZ
VEPELTPLSLGESLRRAREARGLTIQRAEADTRIRRSYLEALERTDLAALPAPVFTRGLVRSYAHYLDLSPVEALELLNKEEERHEHLGVVPTSAPPRLSPPPLARLVWGTVVAIPLGAVLVALYFGLPAYRSYFAATTVRAQATVAPTPSPAPTATATQRPAAAQAARPSPTTPPPSPTAQPSPTLSAEGVATATAAAAVRGVTIEARIGGRVWVQVESDGQIAYSGILMPGEKKTWRAERRVLMHVGDGAMVDLTFNGRTLGRAGPPGEVVKAEWVATR